MKICSICHQEKELNKFYKQKEYKDGHQNKCKICQVIQLRKNRVSLWSKNHKPFLAELCAKAKIRARQKNREFNISPQDLWYLWDKQNALCAISGRPLTHKMNEKRVPTNVSLDRKDSLRGYTKDNIQLVCTIVNTMKTNLPQLDFILWCKDIVNNLT